MMPTTYTPAQATPWPGVRERAWGLSWVRASGVIVALATIMGLAFRLNALSTYGLSEDELNKVRAIESYRAGHFSANAEHPMLMKLAMWGSVDAAEEWNRIAASDQAIPVE